MHRKELDLVHMFPSLVALDILLSVTVHVCEGVIGVEAHAAHRRMAR